MYRIVWQQWTTFVDANAVLVTQIGMGAAFVLACLALFWWRTARLVRQQRRHQPWLHDDEIMEGCVDLRSAILRPGINIGIVAEKKESK